MKALADLHLHSDRSDGLYSPQELVRFAEEKGLGGIALTDHDTLDGIQEFMSTPASTTIQRVPGVEVSTKYNGHELHLLGYFVTTGDTPLDLKLQSIRESRQTRFPKMVDKLRELGIEVDEIAVQKILKEIDSPGRPHLARILIESGVVKDINEAFSKFLATGKPAYVPRPKISTIEVIGLLRNSGAVPVLAHPLLIEDVDLKQLIQLLKSHGLEGVEVDYGYREPELLDRVESIRKITEELGLITTGGSDYHGDDGHYSLGEIVTPVETIDLLRKKSERIRYG
ncbi:MAG: PHP domain-containing protein [Candidatus Thorarchaeota archaeon]|nr:MAG: PHP domain-containing protein [Candidatus Thorarchaeota archaeon]